MEPSFKTKDVSSRSFFSKTGEVEKTLTQQNKGRHISVAFIDKSYDFRGMVFVSVEDYGSIRQSVGDNDLLEADAFYELMQEVRFCIYPAGAISP